MATKRKLYVFLDHLIRRESFLYRRETNAQPYTKKPEEWMKHTDLIGANPLPLRKPDFQRSTYYWTPVECVNLLECLLNEQVVPSVILWLSAGGYQYVLDGAHRISVLLAWLKDDWGDGIPTNRFGGSRQLEQEAREAGQQVRDLLRARNIGSYEEYQQARQRELELEQQGIYDTAQLTLEDQVFAERARKWGSIPLGFPILWVPGDYENARQSFIYINKSGSRLSEWERLLVDHRESPFMRTVMSIANLQYAEHCWPSSDLPLGTTRDMATQLSLTAKSIHDTLFLPLHESPTKDVTQPLLAVPSLQSEKKAPWVAELLTVLESHHTRNASEKKLIAQKAQRGYSDVVLKGQNFMQQLKNALNHIERSTDPRAMGIQPLVYFYNDQGQCIRGLFYGFLFWLTKGSDEDVRTRKRIFTAYRGQFEQVFLASKEQVIATVSRKVGSGAEIFNQSASYFHRTVSLIYQHNGQINTPDFGQSYNNILNTLLASQQKRVQSEQTTNDPSALATRVSQSRSFQGTFRSEAFIPSLISSLQTCSICGGKLKVGEGVHVDHAKLKYAEGGATTAANASPTHAFCNVEKDRIQAIKQGTDRPEMPVFEREVVRETIQMQQASMFVDFDESSDLDDAESSDPEFSELEESSLSTS